MFFVSCPPRLAYQLATTDVQISYEPGPMLIHDPTYLDERVANQSSLLFLNEEEYQATLSYLKGITEQGYEYQKLLALVVTLGKNGSKIVTKSDGIMRTIVIPAVKISEKIVDPTGAGDNYKAGFLSAYMRGRSLDECARVGADLGAACVLQQGGILPDKIVGSIREKYNL